ncbi:type VI secretion system-associated protein TagF [Methylocapsa palsarum]|uniref:Type VI secretion system protein ImpM n=1 Tax=Methylocapsa palsarum TaxID=1612308 RepID=A0A1I3YNJ0_9HYPH|nr:type VI secretion system-associated protein TagF [Methylocapsa palsarum]SFK33382.1 type VI secretion system protein ImpM [Methylocapsa palsarum]
MVCGLFGKLAAKRDFVALSVPREFLRVWEPWIDEGMATGRKRFQPGEWEQAFLSAPIWRFWLGSSLCGDAFTGALMPSVDALGRLFPLTLTLKQGDGERFESPDVDSRDDWFERVEEFLLATLDPRTPFETTLSRLADLPSAPGDPETSAENHASAIFAALRREHRDLPVSAATFWWTMGGSNCAPLATLQRSMPPPRAFADMLTTGLAHPPRAEARLN